MLGTEKVNLTRNGFQSQVACYLAGCAIIATSWSFFQESKQPSSDAAQVAKKDSTGIDRFGETEANQCVGIAFVDFDDIATRKQVNIVLQRHNLLRGWMSCCGVSAVYMVPLVESKDAGDAIRMLEAAKMTNNEQGVLTANRRRTH